MSSLRQVNKDTDDVEAQSPGGSSKASKPRGAAVHNPVVLMKIIVSKVVSLLLTTDEDDISQPGGIITLLKDIILGVIFGVLTISTLIFLDHRNVIHFQSAHHFREAAFTLLNDPETIQTLEESSDMHFMTIAEYESKRKEIDSVADKLKSHEEVLNKRIAEGDEKKKELEGIRGEYDALMNNELLGLKHYCGGCIWGQKTTCDGRVRYLQDTYNTRPIAAKINAMTRPSCKSA